VGWKAGWTPLAIADGLFYANTFKRYPETAALLRRLMQEGGLPVPPPPSQTSGAASNPGAPIGAKNQN
jgi:hypothetical protein